MSRKVYLTQNKKYGFLFARGFSRSNKVTEFYKEEYYKTLAREKRTKEAKLVEQTTSLAKKELRWLDKTQFKDIDYNLGKLCKGKDLVDIGCGSGDFLSYMKTKKWHVFGIEPSILAYKKSIRKKINVFNGTLEEYLSGSSVKRYDAAVMSNVLEHIAIPEKILITVKKILKPGGILYVSVPNDFNSLQLIANKHIKHKKWWVKLPDHINYFNFQALTRLLRGTGFKILKKTTDFPMEFFILMGENYVDEQSVGSICHQKRILFENRLTATLRRQIYDHLALIHIGRQCIFYAMKNE